VSQDGPRDSREIAHWQHTTDVLVVGLGAAGAAAALDAAGQGAEVLVLERAGAGGGTSAMSGGVLYLGGGTPLQKACGFQDDPEEMFKYLMVSCGPSPDEAKTVAYCDDSVEHYSWLVGQGVPFKPVFHPGYSGEPPNDDGLVFSGSENAWPFSEVAAPAPRGHVPRHPGQAGPLLMQKLSSAVSESPVDVLPDHRVVALVLDPDGAAAGVVARCSGEEIAIRARRGTILATGGFINNKPMVETYIPLLRRCKFRVGAEGDDGSGIRLGMSVGGVAIHMDAGSVSLPVTQPWSLKRGVLVNGQGQRFINEDAYYGRLGEYALFRHEGRAWLILDEATFEQPAYPREVAAVGETPGELERELGLPGGSLESTLALYNRHAAEGTDPLFHKSTDYLTPLATPPFGALDCTTENSLYAAFTLGGLYTSVDGEVISASGEPIPRLFAAGRCSSGLSVGSYSSGLSLGDATYFGRRAGRRAASR
jgi:succinate dehydrogenase/fumarate reductase flavoprotein subunit